MKQLKQTLVHLFHPQRSNNHRPRIIHPDSLAVVVAILVGFAAFVMVVPEINPRMGYILGYATDISLGDVVAQTNQIRAEAGLQPLTLNAELNNAAAGKAQDMFAKQYWAHTSPDGVEPWAFIAGAGYSYEAAGENLARDFLHTGDMMSAWMASPTHKANIVNPKYEQIGVAVVNGTLDGVETTLVVQMFGKPQATARQQVAAVPPTAVATQETSENEAEQAPSIPANPPSEELNADSTLTEKMEQPLFEVQRALALTEDGKQPTNASGYLSPLHLIKAFGLAILFLLMGTLVYDMLVMHNQPKVRFVGQNMAHLLFFLTVAFMLFVFKSGFIG